MKLFSRTAFTISVLMLLLACSGQAVAGTLLFVSGDGVGEFNDHFSDDLLTLINGAGNVVITPHPAWAPNQPSGAKWVSFRDTGYNGTAPAADMAWLPTAFFFEYFNLTALLPIDINVWADDTAEVILNGKTLIEPNFTQDICASGPVGCEARDVFHVRVAPSDLHLGQNFLSVSAYQTGGQTFGVMYEATTVPEPASAALLGTGLLAMGLLLRYRRSRKR